MMDRADFIVVGAGLGGLAAASSLQKKGASVTVIDKARGVGGRAATKRFGELRVDTGAQFFTAKGAEFQSWVKSQLPLGEIFEWSYGFPVWENGAMKERPHSHPRYACRSGMSALAKLLARDLRLQLGSPVTTISRVEGEFQVRTQEGAQFRAPKLILNLPPKQLLPLAENLIEPNCAARIGEIHLEPSFAIYGALDQDLDVEWKGLELVGHPLFSWIARDHTRRSPTSPPVIVAHTRPGWSRPKLEAPLEEISKEATLALESFLGVRFSNPLEVHRWRFALAPALIPNPTLTTWDAERKIGICGDWTTGGRVEGAITSGWNLSRAIHP